MAKKILFCIIAALAALNCFAMEASDSNSFALAEIGLGARSAAMGGAYTAVSDMESVNWNPGALGFLDQASLALAYTKWNLDTGFQNILFDCPLGFGVAGLNISYASMGQVDGRDEFGDLNGNKIDASSLGGSLAFAAQVNKNASAGGSVKFFSQTLQNTSMYAVLLDAGLYYRILDNYSAGLGIKNIGFTSDTSGIEEFSLGGSYVTDAKSPNRLLVSADAGYSISYGAEGRLGVEYTFFSDYKLRAGYALRNENSYLGSLPGISFGAGFNISGIEADYAAVSYGDLGLMNTFALSFQFAGAGSAPENSVYEKLVSALADQYMSDAQDASEEGDYEKALRKLASLKGIMPDYPGLDDKISEARGNMDKSSVKGKVEAMFNIGMDYYMRGKYHDALLKWEEVKKLNPDFAGINSWLKFARTVNEKNASEDKAEICFKEGMKSYNRCNYQAALSKWQNCRFDDPSDDRLLFLQEKCKEMSAKIRSKETEAEKYFNNGELVQGVKKVRVILTLCPTSEFATDKLNELKSSIGKQVEKYYNDGLDKYTSGNVADAISSWEKVIELDPAGNTATHARDNIEQAKTKLKNIQMMK